MRACSAILSLLAFLGLTTLGCGSDICDEARQAFCDKACDCGDGTCVVRLNNASLQYYDNVEECIDLAGPQICNSSSTEAKADACTEAIGSMASCGDEPAPPECVVSASADPGS